MEEGVNGAEDQLCHGLYHNFLWAKHYQRE
jgi:hypothetical protein